MTHSRVCFASAPTFARSGPFIIAFGPSAGGATGPPSVWHLARLVSNVLRAAANSAGASTATAPVTGGAPGGGAGGGVAGRQPDSRATPIKPQKTASSTDVRAMKGSFRQQP